MRKELYIGLFTEMQVIEQLGRKLKKGGYNASNSVIVTVSTDYSSIAGQIIRHALTHEGEIASGFGVDVPYPDQNWDEDFIDHTTSMFKLHDDTLENKNIILVEAGVIRGSNYKSLVELIRSLNLDNKIITTSMYENKGSAFKCDYVVSYYDNTTQDLTFWWEKENNHWK